jgi:hypothetical protein
MVLACIALLGGCSATLSPRIPTPAAGAAFDDTLAANASASGMPHSIGYGTFTVFAIKVADVEVSNGDAAELVMAAFEKTLEGYGYRVVKPADAPDAPIFECRVRRFQFKNYTWFAPLVFNWGDIEVDLLLAEPSGRELWARSYGGKSWKFAYSFTRVVNEALEQVLDKAVGDFASAPFREACCAKPVP